jgi:predicted RNA binding protein YcfA (HicA-like mRNA interferase family)
MAMSERKIVPIPYQKLVKIFEADGFVVKRQKGDHLILTKLGVKRPLVIKTSPRKVAVAHILTNLNTASMSRERYFAPLDQV